MWDRFFYFAFGAFAAGGVALIWWAARQPEAPCVEGAPTPIMTMVGKVPVTNYYCLHREHQRVGFYCKCPVASQVGDGGVVQR